MTDDRAWQRPYFFGWRTPGNLTPAPVRPRSDAMRELMDARPAPNPQMPGRDWAAELRDEKEQRLRELVKKFGVEMVEGVLHVRLPDHIAGRNASTPRERKGKRHAD